MTAQERIAALDDRFVGLYEATRAKLVDAQKARALIVVTDDRMLLYHGDRKPQVIDGLRPPEYEKLKSLNHVPLAIYCLLQDAIDGDGVLAQSALAALGDYRRQLAASAADFDTAPEVECGLLDRPIGMFDRALAFLDRVIAEGRTSREDLVAYCRANLGDMNASFLAATKAQLDACHAKMMRLKERVLSAEDWDSLRVVIIGPRMAHKDQNFLQYFARLLHTPMYADRRVVYYEGDAEEVDQALDLLGTTMLDFRAARLIFADDSRLHRDVLSDATKDYLDALLPPRQQDAQA